MIERTFAIIKPDAVKANNVQNIITMIKDKGFNILRQEKRQLSQAEVEQFYQVHKERPFFGELVEYMSSGPVVLMALEKDNAVADWRTLMGATNPAQAAEGTIRKLYGTNIGVNATHGSDATETAQLEIGQFFSELA